MTLDERITRATIAILEEELARLTRQLPKATTPAKSGRRMTAAQRKAVSKRMKALWKNKSKPQKESTE